ncbi:hypothetical protein II906_06585 [bacterium]|nr:hypothetical protein [bacterium]
MKKLFALFMIVFFGMECIAQENFVYQGSVEQNNSIIEKQNKRKYKNIVNVPESKAFHLFSDDFFSSAVPLVASVSAATYDPYIIPIGDIKYILIKDRNGGKWSNENIFGINDDKNNRFSSLISLDKNNDLKITSDELKAENIRFAILSGENIIIAKRKNLDFDLNKLQYIDLNSIKRTINSDNTGIFGHFNVYYFSDEGKRKIAIGYVTFDDAEHSKYIFE